MGAIDITASDVRNRLRASSIILTDDYINSTGVMTMVDGWMDKILADNGTGSASLDANQVKIIKGVKILEACILILSTDMHEDVDIGPIKITGKKVESLIDVLEKQKAKFLDVAGVAEVIPWSGRATADNMDVSTNDETQIDFSTAASDPDYPFRVFK